KSGKLRALAVTSARRLAVLPEYPTVAEAGVPGFEVTGYFGLLAPARTPAPVVATVHAAVQRTLRRRAIIQRPAADGAGPEGCRPAELHALLERDMRVLSDLVRAANIPRQ